MTLWKIDPERLVIYRHLADEVSEEVVPISKNSELRFFVALDIKDYTALIVDYKESCR